MTTTTTPAPAVGDRVVLAVDLATVVEVTASTVTVQWDEDIRMTYPRELLDAPVTVTPIAVAHGAPGPEWQSAPNIRRTP
jgi:hypothetical protein